MAVLKVVPICIVCVCSALLPAQTVFSRGSQNRRTTAFQDGGRETVTTSSRTDAKDVSDTKEKTRPADRKTATKNGDRKPATKKSTSKTTSKTTPRDTRRKLTAAEEKAAISFAKEHHAELISVLNKLRKSNRQHYDRAIRSIASAQKRLSSLRETPRYERDLDEWKLTSRITLMAAKLRYVSAKDEAALKSELHGLIMQRSQKRREQLEKDKQRLIERIEKIDESIDKLNGEHEFARLIEVNKPRRRSGPTNRNTAEKTAADKKKSKSKTSKTTRPSSKKSKTDSKK